MHTTTRPNTPTPATLLKALRLGAICLAMLVMTGCTLPGSLQLEGPAANTSSEKRNAGAPARHDVREELRVTDEVIDRLASTFRTDPRTPKAIAEALRNCSESMVFDRAAFDPGPRSAVIVTVYECGSLSRDGVGNPGDRGPVTKVVGAFLYEDHTTSETLVFESNVTGRALVEDDGDLVGLSLRGDEGVVTHYAWDGTSYVESR